MNEVQDQKMTYNVHMTTFFSYHLKGLFLSFQKIIKVLTLDQHY